MKIINQGVIVNQKKDREIKLKDISEIEIEKITKFMITQDAELNYSDVGKYAVIVNYKQQKTIGVFRVIVTETIGVYSSKEKANKAVEKIYKAKYEMPED